MRRTDIGNMADGFSERSGGEAYEVDVRDAGNTEWDVELDANFKVLRKTVDN